MNFSETAGEILSRTLHRGIENAEVYLLSSRATTIEVKDQKVDAFISANIRGAGLRVIEEGRAGFAFAALSDGSEIDALVQHAVTAAKFTEPDSHNCLPGPTEIPDVDLQLFDSGIAAVPEEEKIARAMTLEQTARERDSRIKVVRKAATHDSEYHVHLLNSRGVDLSFSGTSCSASIMVMADDGTHQEMGWDSDFHRTFSGLDVRKIGRRGADNALQLLGAKAVPTCNVKVLLTPLTAVGFLEVLAAPFSANAVQKEKSLFKDRVGEKVAASTFQLVDNGLLPGGAGTAPFDDEGVPMQCKHLIRNGVLQGYLHNCYTADRAGESSTGNGMRNGYAGMPHVGTTNLYIEAGDLTEEELLRKMDRGLLVTEVMGMHTANPVSGDFSVGVSGLWVEKGRVTHPVRGGAMAGNLIDLLKKIEGIGSDIRFYGSIGSPTLLIGNLSLSGA
ncbi:MAG: TldD/PmbA family protein [Deltaproteobacteria bacterium]|nr:TldD/PmbA family protein [Deltaproteobacteria bacterium]